MPASNKRPTSLDYPELIIGIAGPIGVDMDLIARSLEAAFAGVRYTSTLVKLTSEMSRYPIASSFAGDANSWIGSDTFNTYMRKMSEANALRKQYDDPAVLARIAIDAVRETAKNLQTARTSFDPATLTSFVN